MIKWIAITAVLLANNCLANDNKLDLSQSDRQLHFMLSAQGATIMGLLASDKDKPVKGPLIGFVTMVAIGVAKEFLYDDHPSIGDMKADVLGALAGSSIVFTIKSF